MKRSFAAIALVALAASGCQGISGAEAGEAIHQAWAEEADDFVGVTADHVDDVLAETELFVNSSVHGVSTPEGLALYAEGHLNDYTEEIEAFRALPAPESQKQYRDELLGSASGVSQWLADTATCVRDYSSNVGVCEQRALNLELSMNDMMLTYVDILDEAPVRPTS